MPGKPLDGVLLGVCGSSMATIAAELVAALRTEFTDRVEVVVTPAGRRFLPRLDVPVHRDRHWRRRPLHVTLADRAELVVVAPATANTLVKASAGLADNLLLATLLGSGRPAVLFPAMNVRMWCHPAVRRAVDQLRADGHLVAEPIGATAASSDRYGDAVGFDTPHFTRSVSELLSQARSVTTTKPST
ncbi:flavoprotein [Kitasatospora purpeofusca]|uniref:flavoprotein n=1 Tax=Kitasatospora purpeofusca TaxID=67352 RepID=UPI00380B65B5